MNTNPITPTKHDTTPVNTVTKNGGTTGNEKKDKVAPEIVNKLLMDSAMGAKLRDIAKDPETWKKEVEKVIGKTGLDEKGLEAARQKMLKGFETGDFSFLNVHIVPDGDTRLGKGGAAYAGGDDKSKDGIYISESVAKDPAKLGEAFFEELGHWVDDQARAKGGDAKGDEGERFMHHLAGTPSPLSAMSENDHSKSKIEGKDVEVENNKVRHPGKEVEKKGIITILNHWSAIAHKGNLTLGEAKAAIKNLRGKKGFDAVADYLKWKIGDNFPSDGISQAQFKGRLNQLNFVEIEKYISTKPKTSVIDPNKPSVIDPGDHKDIRFAGNYNELGGTKYDNFYEFMGEDLDFNGSKGDGFDSKTWTKLKAGLVKNDPEAKAVADKLMALKNRYNKFIDYNNGEKSGLNAKTIATNYKTMAGLVKEIESFKNYGFDIDLSNSSHIVSAYNVASLYKNVNGSATPYSSLVQSIENDVKLFHTLKLNLGSYAKNINGMSSGQISNVLLDNIDKTNRDLAVLGRLQYLIVQDMKKAQEAGASLLEIGMAAAKGAGVINDIKTADQGINYGKTFMQGLSSETNIIINQWSDTFNNINKNFDKAYQKEISQAKKAEFQKKISLMFDIVSLVGGAADLGTIGYSMFSLAATRSRNFNKVRSIQNGVTDAHLKDLRNNDKSLQEYKDIYYRINSDDPAVIRYDENRWNKDKPDLISLAISNENLVAANAAVVPQISSAGFAFGSDSNSIDKYIRGGAKSGDLSITLDSTRLKVPPSYKESIKKRESYQKLESSVQDTIKLLLKRGISVEGFEQSFRTRDVEGEADRRLREFIRGNIINYHGVEVDDITADGNVFDVGDYLVYASLDIKDAGDQGKDTGKLTIRYEKKIKV